MDMMGIIMALRKTKRKYRVVRPIEKKKQKWDALGVAALHHSAVCPDHSLAHSVLGQQCKRNSTVITFKDATKNTRTCNKEHKNIIEQIPLQSAIHSVIVLQREHSHYQQCIVLHRSKDNHLELNLKQGWQKARFFFKNIKKSDLFDLNQIF